VLGIDSIRITGNPEVETGGSLTTVHKEPINRPDTLIRINVYSCSGESGSGSSAGHSGGESVRAGGVERGAALFRTLFQWSNL